MKILEVTAFPPKIYGQSEQEVTQKNDILSLLRGSLSWGMTKKGEDILLLADPVARPFSPTQLIVRDLTGASHTNNLGTAWFIENKEAGGTNTNYDVQIPISGGTPAQLKGDLLGDLTAANMAQNAINYWEVPDEYIAGYGAVGPYSPIDDTVDGYMPTITSAVGTGSVTWAPNVSNKKAGYCQSVRVKLYSPASGDSLEKNIYDPLPQGSVPTGSYVLYYTIGADLRSEGYPICAWNYADNGEDQRLKMIEYIKGGQWRKIALTNNGLAGSYFQQLSNIKNRGNMALGMLATLGGGIALAGMGNAAPAIAGAITNYDNINTPADEKRQRRSLGRFINEVGLNARDTLDPRYIGVGAAAFTISAVKIHDQEQELNRQGICAATPQFTNNSDFIKDIGHNRFFTCISSYNSADLVDYDCFLERYGYNVGNMIIGTQHFYSRENFVYVRVNDITITSDTVGRQILDKVAIQLKAGVRIWRHKVNIDAMNPGGNGTPNPEAYNS